jgi:hypothetical protein
MLKVFLNITVAINLLISMTGFTLSKHYCGDELVSFSIDKEAKSCCGTACEKCRNESKYFKLDERTTSPVISQQIQTPVINLSFPVLSLLNSSNTQSNFCSFIYPTESPPGKDVNHSSSYLQTFLI